jgi:hypothetical protein
VEQDRIADAAWVRRYLDLLCCVARDGYAKIGGGAVVASLTKPTLDEDHPLVQYVAQEAMVTVALAVYGEPEPVRMMGAYGPTKEFVLVTSLPGKVSPNHIVMGNP